MAKVLHPRLFPFCIPYGTISGGSYIKTDLAGAMRIYWKIKTTTFVGIESGGGPTKTFTFYRQLYGYEIPNEEYLVCDPGYGHEDDQGYSEATFSVNWESAKTDGKYFYIPLHFFFNAGDNSGKFAIADVYGTPATINIYGFNVEASIEGYPAYDPQIFLSVSQPSVTYWDYSD